MQTNSSHHLVIIVLTEHPVLGVLLIPYMAEAVSGEDTIHLMEQASHASANVQARMTAGELKSIEIASYYSEKYLMQVYSREKTVARFLHKLTSEPEKIKESIRPFIDKKLNEMIQLMLDEGLTLYQRQSGGKVLYPHNAYHINRQPVETSFTFELSDSSFSYQVTCAHQGQLLPLTEQKPVIVLATHPATLLLGMNLYIFSHIEASRLLPFTKKTRVTVDATHLQKYIDNIIIPIAGYHHITTSGLDISEEHCICDPLLYLDETIYDDTLLRLAFRYGQQIFSPEELSDRKKWVHREESAIRYFCRNSEAEQQAIGLLIDNGLEQISDSHFKLSPTATENNLTRWIFRHREMLQTKFHLSSATQEKPYCLDEIRIEQSYQEEGPDWFELHIKVVVGNFNIPFSHFRKHILQEDREYTLPDGQLILLPEEWFSKYANLFEMAEEHDRSFRLKRPFIGIAEDLLLREECPNLPAFGRQSGIAAPKGLKAQLRHYQQEGFTWLTHLYEVGFGGCLADDMGLGKTLQTLALLQSIYGNEEEVLKENPQAVALVEGTIEAPLPSSVDEIGQFILFDDWGVENTLSSFIAPDPNAPVSPRPTVAVRSKPSTLIVVPTSLLHNWQREARRFTTLSMTEYNSNSRFRKGHPEYFFNRYNLIFTTYGTLRNNLDILREYHFECIVLDESQNIKNSDSLTFRSAIQLQGRHRLVLTGTPIENSLKDLWAQFHFLQPDLLGEEAAFNKRFVVPIRQGSPHTEKRLRQLITPFILRRNKREVAPELPPLTEETIHCGMTNEQSELYQQEKNSLRNILLELNERKERHQSLTVLNGILRLRQLACHPAMVSPDFTGPSGKLEQIIETFETLRSEGHKVLIFSSFVKHLELVANAFRERGWSYAWLTGSSTNRPEEIARFTESKEMQAFLISLKAGGVGLNLTQADYVFIIDPWWNPAAEAQAIARAHRIGQERQVIAYRFITQGSIEEKIIRLQEGKRKLAETFITDTEALSALTDQEWAGLLQ